MKKHTIYGLPLNPMPLLDELRGGSFCVSYATRDKLGRQLDQAIERHKRALEIDPERDSSQYSWGNALMSLGKLDQADAALQRAQALRPKDRRLLRAARAEWQARVLDTPATRPNGTKAGD